MARRARDECQRAAAEDEGRGGRQAQAARQQLEADDHGHQEQRELEKRDPGQDASRPRRGVIGEAGMTKAGTVSAERSDIVGLTS